MTTLFTPASYDSLVTMREASILEAHSDTTFQGLDVFGYYEGCAYEAQYVYDDVSEATYAVAGDCIDVLMQTITYILGDLSNGDFAKYETEAEAMLALEEAITDGTLANMEVIGEMGCPWETEEDAREASEEFFYVKQVTEERDDNLTVVWEQTVIIAGNIQ